MHAAVLGDLTIDVEAPSADRIVLRWKGASNTRDPGTDLKPFFDAVLAEARARNAAVEQHFDALTFFNSSTVSLLLRLVIEAGQSGIPMSLHYDATLRWQERNFEGIAALSLPLLRIESTAASRS